MWFIVLALTGCLGVDSPKQRVKHPARGEDSPKSGKRRGGADSLIDFVETKFRGKTRGGYVHVPKGLPAGKKVPAIVMHHGGKGAKGKGAGRYFAGYANGDYILVFPNGQIIDPDLAGWQPLGADTGEHVTWETSFLDTVIADYPIDPKKIYAAGFSNGAQQTLRMTCMKPNRFQGVAIVAQTVEDNTLELCPSWPAIPTLYITGTADPKNPADGREGRVGVGDTVDYFLKANKCEKKPSNKALPNRPGDKTSVVQHNYTCKGKEVEYLEVEGGAHFWPSSTDSKGGDHCGDIETSDVAVAFWKTNAGL